MAQKDKTLHFFSDSVLEHYAVLFSLFVLVATSPLIMFLLLQKDLTITPRIPILFQEVVPQAICSYQKVSCSNDQSCDSAVLTCPSTIKSNIATPQNPFLPVGLLENADCSNITGWSYNSYFPNRIMHVTLYTDGTYVTGKPIATFLANLQLDSNDVVDLIGPHEFYYPYPDNLKDGLPHQIYAYGSDASGSGQLSLLLGSPKVVSCKGTTDGTGAKPNF